MGSFDFKGSLSKASLSNNSNRPQAEAEQQAPAYDAQEAQYDQSSYPAVGYTRKDRSAQLVLSGMMIICTSVSLGCLIYGLTLNKDKVMSSGTLSWELAKKVQDIIGATNAVSDKVEDIANTGTYYASFKESL